MANKITEKLTAQQQRWDCRWVVCWHSNATGYESEGQPLRREVAEKVMAEANKQFPQIAHWLREVK